MTDHLARGKKMIEQAVREGKIPGASFALVTPDHVELGFTGSRQIIPDVKPVEVDTVYDMASCTKVIATTTMALRLIEDGCFSLDTHLKDILPDFEHPEVTIKHLLTHTSGICPDDKAYKTCHGEQEMWNFFRNKPLEFEPGTKVLYSDFGYIALGFVIEKFAGPLDQYAQKIIFDPLKMHSTCYCPKKHGIADRCAATEVTADRGVIVGSCHDGKGFRLDGVSGNAGLFSTVNDLSVFVQMMLNCGSWNGHRVLQESTVNLLKNTYTANLNVRRTLGWITDDPNQSDGDYYSSCCLYHTGFSGTSVYIDFSRNCGIILLTNRVHPTRDNPNIVSIRNLFHNLVLLDYDADQEDHNKI
jgi:CubicO group peptidase (beta-lactamase class C family)